MSFETPIPPYNASDPYATFLSSSLFDLLMIEMVPLAYRLAAVPPQSRRTKVRDKTLLPKRGQKKPVAARVKRKGSGSGEATRSGEGGAEAEEEEEEEGGSGQEEERGESAVEEAGAMGEDEGGEESSSDDSDDDDGDDGMVPITGPGADGTAGYAGTDGPEGEGEEAERERAYKRCEGWGYRVGQGVVERLVLLSPSFPLLFMTTCGREQFAVSGRVGVGGMVNGKSWKGRG